MKRKKKERHRRDISPIHGSLHKCLPLLGLGLDPGCFLVAGTQVLEHHLLSPRMCVCGGLDQKQRQDVLQTPWCETQVSQSVVHLLYHFCCLKFCILSLFMYNLAKMSKQLCVYFALIVDFHQMEIFCFHRMVDLCLLGNIISNNGFI